MTEEKLRGVYQYTPELNEFLLLLELDVAGPKLIFSSVENEVIVLCSKSNSVHCKSDENWEEIGQLYHPRDFEFAGLSSAQV